MRVTKFRAWHKKEQRICEVSLIRPDDGAFLEGVAVAKPQIYGDIKIMVMPAENGRYCPMDDISLMQYIGLEDENGVGVYKGDVVKRGDELWVIEWNDRLAQFVMKGPGGRVPIPAIFPSVCEVIGNIYENPELLD